MTLEQAKEITNDDGTLKEVNYEFVELRLGNHCNVQCGLAILTHLLGG